MNRVDSILLTNKQARQFILFKQGLLGDYKFIGEEGVLEFVRQAGCIQFDPIDICGKNAELVLQSRVRGFTKKMLYELLYEDRKLIDYFDKNLAIMEAADWPYFERFRNENQKSGRGRNEVDEVAEEIKAVILEKGPVSSKDIDFNEKVDWYWNNTKLSRAALETLYFRGELIVHHKKGTNKYYDLAENCFPEELLKAEDPYPDEIEHKKWRALRRISSIGLLWNKPSSAWLGIWDFGSKERNIVFEELLMDKLIIEVAVEDCKDKFYCLSQDIEIIHEIQKDLKLKSRVELIAPLDNMIWDRNLIKKLYGFDYTWEVYTPVVKRKYGHYVLPILKGDQFIGRTEVVADSKNKALIVKNIWFEHNTKPTKAIYTELDKCYQRFMKFNEMDRLQYETEVAIPTHSISE
ncbi:MAG: crosslink repair DNA glycosylase YcaQ family protein [Mobilitalea sp.]